MCVPANTLVTDQVLAMKAHNTIFRVIFFSDQSNIPKVCVDPSSNSVLEFNPCASHGFYGHVMCLFFMVFFREGEEWRIKRSTKNR